MRIALAGPIAEAKSIRKPMRSLGARRDFASCAEIARKLHLFREFISDYTDLPPINVINEMNQARAATRRWVGSPFVWQLIERVAEELMQHEFIERYEFECLVGEMTTKFNQHVLWQYNYNE